jgi:hypothetical protein
MAKISGAAGTATFDSTEYYITGWSCDVSGEVIKTTDSSNTTWDAFIAAGFTSWSGSFEGFQETNTADPTVGGAAATLVLELDGTRNYTGSAIITGVSTSADVPGSEAITKSFTFQGTGTLTLTNA